MQDLILQRARLNAQIRAMRIKASLASLVRAPATGPARVLEKQLCKELMRPLRRCEDIDDVLDQLEVVLNVNLEE